MRLQFTSSSCIGFLKIVLTLPGISGEYIVFTIIYEGRNVTGMIFLLVVVIKNKEMESASNIIEQNRRIKFETIRFDYV